ncbi:MAG: hypothetical protein WAQ52_10660 [Terriglobales bacterium]
MKAILCSAVVCCLLVPSGLGQEAGEKAQPHNTVQAEARATSSSSQAESSDIEQMRDDVERLKVLLNQMRTNLAFVQTSQTPLKHQFELEVDAWQVIVEQMERRLKQMKDRSARESAR